MGTMTVAVKVCSGNLRLNRVLVGKEELHLSHCGSLPAGSTAEAVSAGRA
jgi:hypothetical protein